MDRKRIGSLIMTNIKFQMKYGFYFLYAVFTVLYLFVLSLVPSDMSEITVELLIFSDPAVMGLFFMGAIVLLERNQRVIESLAVSPVCFEEYLIGKVVSIGIISIAVSGILLAGAARHGTNEMSIIEIGARILAVFGASTFFSLLGVLAAFYSESLMQFVMYTIPVELVFSAPGILQIFGIMPKWMCWCPGIMAMIGIRGNVMAAGLIYIWVVAAFVFVKAVAERKYRKEGGINL